MNRPLLASLLAVLATTVALSACDKLGSGTTPKPTTGSAPAASAPP
jgi:hypothetical protein